MSYTYLEEEAIADIAFKARGTSLTEVFYQSGMATANLQTNIEELKEDKSVEINLKKKDYERLLHRFLEEILYLKDADLFFVKDIRIQVEETEDGWNVSGEFVGEIFNPDKHEMGNDLKAITWHNFYLKKVNGIWESYVLIDI